MNELNRIYEAVLIALGNRIAANGKVTLLLAGQEHPLRIDGRDLYLPISEALNADSDQKVYFHPACENIVSKETEVFKMLRRLAGIRLLTVFQLMAPVFMDVASKKEKKSWSQNVHDVIAPFNGVKKAIREELVATLARMRVETEDNVDNRFVHFKVTKGGKGASGERVYYKVKPVFPFYDLLVRELARTEGQAKSTLITVNNYSISRECIDLIVHMFRSVLPAVNNPDQCEYDATIPVAARFTAFMYCFGELCEQMNRAQNMFRQEFDKAAVYSIDLSWQEKLEDIPEYYRQVPELSYNSHNVYNEGAEQQQAIGGNLSGLLSITSTQQTNGTVVTNGPVVTNGMVVNNQGIQQQQPTESTQMFNGMQFVTTPPLMQNGDRYVRFEINVTGPTPRVHHYALDMSGNTVMYICTQMGTLLHRQTAQPQQPYYGAPQTYYGVPQQPQPYYGAPQQPQPYYPAPTVVSPDPITGGW